LSDMVCAPSLCIVVHVEVLTQVGGLKTVIGCTAAEPLRSQTLQVYAFLTQISALSFASSWHWFHTLLDVRCKSAAKI